MISLFSVEMPIEKLRLVADLKKVTLFNDRSQVFRYGRIKLLPGEYALHLNGVWGSTDRSSLQVSVAKGGESAVLKSVQFTTVKHVRDIRKEREDLEEELKVLEKKMRAVGDNMSLCRYRIACYAAMGEKVSGGPHEEHHASVYDPTNWLKVAQFVRENTAKYTKELRGHEDAHKALSVELRILKDKITARTGSDQLCTTSEVAEVVVVVTKETELHLVLSYMVRGTSWNPIYDLRIDTASKAVAMTYDAQVRQSTGEDWRNVQLELSTATPHFGGDPPEHKPWRVSLSPSVLYQAQPAARLNENMMMQQMYVTSNMMPTPGFGGGAGAPLSRTAAPARSDSAAVSSSATALTFTIPGAHTVLCNNEPLKVTIAQHTFDGHFRYSAVPKLSPSTYLKVKAVNNTPYIFLPGKANIFADNQLISSSSMDLVNPNEEFWTFVGVDDSITVKRKLIHQKRLDTSSILSGKRKTIEFKYTFTVKSTKKATEELVVWDQFPISEDNKITVTLVEPVKEPKGNQQKVRFETNDLNAIEWFWDVEGGAEKKFNYMFTVECAADDEIGGAMFRED